MRKIHKGILVFVLVLVLAIKLAYADRIGWYPDKFFIQELNTKDEFNGIGNYKCVRPIDIEERNKYGYGFVEQYGLFNSHKYINVLFQFKAISFSPFDLEVVILEEPYPTWIILRRYGWFYERIENGNMAEWYENFLKKIHKEGVR